MNNYRPRSKAEVSFPYNTSKLKHSSASSYIGDYAIFKRLLDSRIESGSEDEIIDLIEQFFLERPFYRPVLFGFYTNLINSVGSVRLAKEVARVFVETTDRLLEIGRRDFGLPPILDSYWMLERIGELADQSASVKFMKKLNKLDQKLLLCTFINRPIVNKAFIPYLSDCFEIITDAKDCNYILDQAALSPVDPSFFKHSNTSYGHNSGFFSASYADLISMDHSPVAFSLKDETITVAQKFLKKYGLELNDQFVVFHVREGGYIDAIQHQYRNSDPNDYREAINWLLDAGFKVVRIGHSKMTILDGCDGLIDLTKIERPGEVDIYLCGAASFYFGSGSGPFSLAYNFGVPIAYSSAIPYGRTRPNVFKQFLKLKNKETNEAIGFSGISEMGLELICSPKILNRYNLVPSVPSSREHLDFVKEMLEYMEEGPIFKLNKSRFDEKQKQGIMEGLCSQSLELL